VDSGFYAACAGLVAKMKALESTAHNLANASTTAFKGERVDFQSLLAQSGNTGLSAVNQAINSFGVAGDPSLDMAQGSLEPTGNQFDVGLEGPGYLAVQTKAGTAYTRNGHLELSSTGQLVTGMGDAVLGDSGPITVPNGSLSISPSGVLSVDGAIVGTLKVVEFGPQDKVQETSPGVFLSNGKPVAATKTSVRQGALEAANVSPIESAVGLIAIQREAEMLQRALSMFHGELNKVATTDLAKV
jgi:flagellar basal-body rod protein FlgF/flagellar basal-body rod protein FlgG